MNKMAEVLGKRIRSLRQAKGISQERLAELSELHSTYIGQIERGEKNASTDSIYKISKGLGVKMEKLFDKIEGGLESEEEDYAEKIYNEILGLPKEKKEKLWKIVKEIISLW